MSAFFLEWFHLVARWAHVIAAIMWVGDSFLFMWLDSHLEAPRKPREGTVVGELWMTHSGGFYEVVKRKSLGKDELPPTLHWFKWESYSTWITGMLLVVIVYWAGGRAMMLETTSTLTQAQAVLMSLGLLIVAVVVYDLVCRTPLIGNNRVFASLGLIVVVALTFGLLQVFSPRAVFLQVGAMLGTIMASNVFFRIIPAQKHMLAATRAGTPVDTSYGARAKQRSVHNHYLSLPVLFLMLSNHFPTTFGHPQAWAVLGLLCVFGVGIKYTMNFRRRTHPVILLGTGAALVVVIGLTAPRASANASANASAGSDAPAVPFSRVEVIMAARCVSCHAQKPSSPMFAAAPSGVMLDTPARIQAQAERIRFRAVETKTMPLGNMTGMTDEERALLGAWIAQGARLEEAATR